MEREFESVRWIKLGAVHADSIKEKEENLREAFKTCIEQKIYEISKFEEQLNKYNISDKTTSSLIQLLAICTNDNSLKTIICCTTIKKRNRIQRYIK